MPSHVFDANVLKNFLLAGLVSELARVCPGSRRVPGTVWGSELAKLHGSFARLHRELPLEDRARYEGRLRSYPETLRDHHFARVNLFAQPDDEELAFLACLLDEDRIDPGEAECLAIAAYRGATVYSDDYAFKLEVDMLNRGLSACPRTGYGPPLHLPVMVHGTVHLLHQAIDGAVLTREEAEQRYAEMRDQIGSRLPPGTLANLRKGPTAW